MTDVVLKGEFLKAVRGLKLADGGGAAWSFDAPTNTLRATVRLVGYTVATLPAGTIGDMAYVTDAVSPGFRAIATGGGSVMSPVHFDGVDWRIG
jgi:hypothetical protein